MTNQIKDPPNQYDFGYDFNYAVWTPGTIVSMVNVPWNNDYRDIVRFANRTALNTYINSLSGAGITISGMSYVKPGQAVRINVPFNRAYKYNYLRASNPVQPIPGSDEVRDYYYFITDIRYLAPNTTEVVLQLDVWQTFGYDITFGNCYVERGHIGIANTNNFVNYGRDYLTVPEGFDLGSEYQTIATRTEWIMSPTPWEIDGRYPSCDVLVVSTADITADPGTVDNPKLVSATGGSIDGTSHGAMFWVFDIQQFGAFMTHFKNTPWLTQSIISITMIPKVTRYHPGFVYSEEVYMPVEASGLPPITKTYDMYVNWRNGEDIVTNIPPRYRHLKKLWTYPYMAVQMTTYSATPIAIKPEAWNNDNARVFERATMVPPGQRIEIGPRFYNSKIASEADAELLWPIMTGVYTSVRGDDYGDYLDIVTQIANFPTMAVVNNGALGYLAANTHGIAFSRQSADWTQSRALGTAQASYDVQTQAMHTMQSLAGIGMNADIGQTANVNRTQAAQAFVGAIGSVAGGAGAGIATGALFGPEGAAAGLVAGTVNGVINGAVQGVQAGIQIGANDEALAIRQNAAGATVRAQTGQAQYARDTNNDLATWAARGDYGNAIAGVNARVQDAALIQPTTSGQMGGETSNIANGGMQMSVRFKMIDQAAITRVGEYWLRYGYAIRKFITPPANMMVMNKFTYWKLSETYISSGPMPEKYKQTIRGIFEKGVTVWANPADIGNIDIANNDALPGITY